MHVKYIGYQKGIPTEEFPEGVILFLLPHCEEGEFRENFWHFLASIAYDDATLGELRAALDIAAAARHSTVAEYNRHGNGVPAGAYWFAMYP